MEYVNVITKTFPCLHYISTSSTVTTCVLSPIVFTKTFPFHYSLSTSPTLITYAPPQCVYLNLPTSLLPFHIPLTHHTCPSSMCLAKPSHVNVHLNVVFQSAALTAAQPVEATQLPLLATFHHKVVFGSLKAQLFWSNTGRVQAA